MSAMFQPKKMLNSKSSVLTYLRPLEMMLMPDNKTTIRYTIKYVIWANQKTESFEYHRLLALATFYVMSLLQFYLASDFISSSVDTLIELKY